MGARVLGISCITNLAAGMQAKLSHDEVKETAERVRGRFVGLLSGVLGKMGAS
jgi:purine-nucleoside phosphorylase